MATDNPGVEVVDVPQDKRFEVRVDGETAGFAAYRLSGDRVVFTHTEVQDRFEGQGIGSRLAKGALDEVRSRGQQIVPRCPFIAAYVQRHGEYADLIVREENS